MANTTVKDLAKATGIEIDSLIQKFSEAGLPQTKPDDEVNDEQRQQLIGYIRGNTSSPRKVTLTRKKKTELKLGSGPGKTVNVQVRKQRTYVKPSQAQLDQQREQEEQEARRQAEEEAAQLAAQQEAEKERERALKAEQEKQQATQTDAADVSAPAKPEAGVEPELTEQQKAKKTKKHTSAKDAAFEDGGPAKKGKKGKPKAEPTKRGKVDFDDFFEELRGGESEIDYAASKQRKPSKSKITKKEAQAKTQGFQKPASPVVRTVEVPTSISVGELAQRMAVKASELIKVMMKMGIMATINQDLDQETAMLVVEEMGHKAVALKENAIEEEAFKRELDGPKESRPPVVTIMGHVDHGKTSLLDHIRRTRVTAGEAGGITQHIGAYHVETASGIVTFLDTPGHEAFTAMRARGADVTDIVVLVVAADDGVMPQTKEAIVHARAAGVPLIVAVNKIDKNGADPEKIKTDLSQNDVIAEDWGGDVMFVPVSAKTGQGIDTLLDSILLQSEVLELQAVAQGQASGIVVESRLEKGKGPVATVLIQQGTLNKGDAIVAGRQYGRIRALHDEAGGQVKSAGPSIPVEVIGLSGTPDAGDEFAVVANERKAREVAEHRQDKHRVDQLARMQADKMDNLFERMGKGEDQQLFSLVVKADTQGSVEAVTESLRKLSTDEIVVKIIASGTGGINESDINLALASNAALIGFNVRADAKARKLAEQEKIELRYYSVIYGLIEDVRQAMTGMLAPEKREEIVGVAEVRDVFRSPKLGAIAGCMVTEGAVKRNNPIRVLRDNVVIYEGQLESLRRFKDDATEVSQGKECGIGVKNYNDVKVGDQIEVYKTFEVARSL